MKKNQSRQVRRAGRGFLLRSAGVWACLLGIVGAGSRRPRGRRRIRRSARELAERWRAERRIIDLHEHLDYTPEALGRAIKVLNASGIGLAVDLMPGTVNGVLNGEPSEFERHKQMEDALFPGRWLQYMNLDYRNWEQPDFAQQCVRQVEEGYRLGAAGFKEWKRLGLYLRDGKGNLIAIDDPNFIDVGVTG